MMPLYKVFIAIAIMFVITYFTRAVPFLFFRGKKPGKMVLYLGEYIPPVILSILVVYCLKDIEFLKGAHGVNEFLSLGVVVALHLWKKNALISIFGGTILYMVLVQGKILYF